MKLRTAVLALLSLISLSLRAETISYTVNNSWQFRRADAPEDVWTTVNIPHTWNALDTDDDVPGYFRGKGIYRKVMDIPQHADGRRVYLLFEGVGQVCDVLVDGVKAASHLGAYSAFVADITSFVTAGKSCEVTVIADNSHDPDIPPLSADFNFQGGIYRDVYIVVKDPVNISILDKASSGLYITTPSVSAENARVSARLLLNNALEKAQKVVVDCQVVDPQGNVVAGLSERIRLDAGCCNFEVSADFDIDAPQLWSPDSPALYTLKAVLKDARTGEVYDKVSENFGLRWFRFDPQEGFFLNGEHLKLIGTNRHQDFKDMGWALDDSRHISDMKLLKEMGGNFLRVSHYPQDPLILKMCDKLGILASVEIPIVNSITESQAFSDNCVLMAEEMVKQSFNHPSVIIWAYMNEVMLRLPYEKDTPEYRSYCEELCRQARRIEDVINSLDPARETLMACHSGIAAYAEAGLVDVPSLIGLNYYYGWYGRTVDYLDHAIHKRFRENHPEVPLLVTEYGADIDNRIHSLRSPESFDYSVEYGDFFQEHYLKTFLQTPCVAGCFLWNLNEFYAEPRSGAVPHVNLKGIVTLDRKPKNTYWLYKANLTDEPFVKFADSDWTVRAGEAGEKHRIKVYSNCDAAALFHNGSKVADLAFEMGTATVWLPLEDGLNRFFVQSGASVDVLEIDYLAQKPMLKDGFSQLNVLLGSARSFTESGICWVPEKEYAPGSWGYVGGEAYRPKSGDSTLPAAEISILGTDSDPMYQTQRRGLEAFRADVPDGKYSVYLHWAELVRPGAEKLLYNLGRDSVYDGGSERIFSVSVNGTSIHEQLNVLEEVGPARPFVTKVDVTVEDGEGICVGFKPCGQGQTMLTAVRIVKLD